MKTPPHLVLVVDDDAVSLKATVRVLTQAGYRVEEAVDGETAVQKARRLRPSLMLVDMLLPDMPGTEVLRRIRAEETMAGTSVVLLSAQLVSPQHQAEGLDAGAEGYIARPIASQELLARVRAHLRQRELTDELRASERRLRELIRRLADGVVVVDGEGLIRLVNPAAESMFGRSAAELVGMPFGLPTDHEGSVDLEVRRADGGMVLAELRVGVTEWDGLPARIASLHDITERSRLQGEANRLARRLATTLESIADGVLTLDRDWRVTYVNAEGERMLERSRSELIGRNLWEEYKEAVGTVFHQEYHRAVRDNQAVAFQQFYAPLGRWFEVRAYPSSDGLAVFFRDVTESRERERRIAEQAALLDIAHEAIMVRDLEDRIVYWNRGAERTYGWLAAEACGRKSVDLLRQDPKQFEQARSALLEKGAWVGEMLKRTRDGRVLTVDVSWTLVRDEGGAPKSVLAINTDITERVRLEAQFLRAQRMESIGTLAGGIAHDLNNVLAPIMMSIELLKLRTADSEALKMLETIATSAQRGADMVKQVLSFARGMGGQRVQVQVNHLVRDVAKISEETFPKNIQIEARLDRGLWVVAADPTQLHQVVLNLLVNARDAMPGGGHIRITTENVTIDEQYAAMNIEAEVGRYVKIEVQDSGTGIPKENLEKIFDPFFTTKEVGKGTGLGLATVLAIVKGHGGFVRVYSEPGVGARFSVFIPVNAEGAIASVPALSEWSPPRGRGETVLVVDDEASIRSITQQTLEAFGYRVLVASDGAEAVSIYIQSLSEISVVMTDMSMPIMDGAALARVLRRINPRVRIIGMSGIGSAAGVANAVGEGLARFLPKPFTAETLLTELRKVLDQGGS